MKRGVYDVEVYPNFFSCYVIDYDSDEEVVFEISERRNDLEAFVSFIGSVGTLIGFNSSHYDNVIVMYLYKEYKRLQGMDYLYITRKLKELNDLVIGDDGTNRNLYSRYKYNIPFKTIDLFLYWSKMLRISKKLSLKSLAVNVNWHRIQELPHTPDTYLTVQDIPDVIEYNGNDAKVTKYLAKEKMSKDINLRAEAQKKYEFPCMSWDGVKLGLNILVKRYCDRTGLNFGNVNQLRTIRTEVDIGSILLPIVNFEKQDDTYIRFVEDKKLVTRFKSFYGLWCYLKGLKVKNTSDINCQVMFQGNRYDIKSGGLHTFHKASVVTPSEDEYYRDKDVSSYYPTLGAEWTLIPEHLGKEFAEELDAIRHDRLTLKANGLGKSNDANLLKLAMNGGFYGNTNNEYTAMFDMQCMLSITINGQLLLLMLCEQLTKIGVRIDMCNTDGITILYKKHLHNDVERICDDWQKLTRMELETVVYTKVVRMNINNYMAFYEEKGIPGIKQKGLFLTFEGKDDPIDQSRDFLVIAKAIKAYYKEGTPIEQFITNHKDIYDFCSAQKVDKKYTVFWNGKAQQRLNRYYVTKRGAYLYKSKDGENMEHLMKGYTVNLFNDYVKLKDYKIDYSFYITKTKEIMNELEPAQLRMF